jgi:uncharacterized membrane protein HdeD (DUF308 family)
MTATDVNTKDDAQQTGTQDTGAQAGAEDTGAQAGTQDAGAPKAGAAPPETPAAAAKAAPVRTHPLARKGLWLGLASFVSLLAGAGLAAAPLVASDGAPTGWMAAAFALTGGATLLMAFASPRWGGVTGSIIQGAALLIGAALVAFGALEPLAPAAVIAGWALVAAGVGGFFATVGAIGARGWPLPLIAGVAAAGAGGAMITLSPPPGPWTPFVAAGAALIVGGLCLSGLAAAARKAAAA